MLLNRARALAFMRQSGIDALVATSPTNVLYVGDCYCWLDPLFKTYMSRPGASADLSPNFALLPLHGEPALVLPAMWAANAAECWISDVWAHGAGEFDFSALPVSDSALLQRVRRGVDSPFPDAVTALAGALRERRLADARIGIELEGLPASVQQRLRNALPRAELRDCSNLLRLIRAVKSAEEIARLERSARINVAAATEVFMGARAGTTLRDLRRRYGGAAVGI